jgi:galacturonosyltransferase
MRIIICGNTFWSLKNFREELIKKLSKKSTIYLISDGSKKNYFKFKKKISTININFNNKIDYLIIFKEIKNLMLIYYQYHKIKPDVVLSFNIKPVIYNTIISFFFPKTKVINTITGSGRVFQKKHFLYKLVSKIYIFIIRKSNYIFFQNKFDKNLFSKNNLQIEGKSKIVNGSGVNLLKYNNTNSDKLNCNFLFASRLMHIKGILYYLKAAEIIKKKFGKQVKFYVAGDLKDKDGDYLSSKELNYFKKSKIIEYLGFQSDIRKILKKANCIVLPTKLNEGIPRVLIEAAASSKFLISTDRPGCNTIIRDNYNGYLIKNINEKNLAKKMLKYLSLTNSQKRKFYNNSKNISLMFDEKNIANIYFNQINKIK